MTLLIITMTMETSLKFVLNFIILKPGYYIFQNDDLPLLELHCLVPISINDRNCAGSLFFFFFISDVLYPLAFLGCNL